MATVLYPGVRGTAWAVSVGGSAADFLEFEVGGRSAGMGGAHTGVATGVTAQFWNPALLATLRDPEVGAMHASWLQDLSYEWAGYARPLGSGLGVGSASVTYFHMPSIQGVDEFNNPTETFRVYDLAATFGLARPIVRGLNAGVNLKMIRQNLATESATGVAADVGLAASVFGGTVGFAVQNLGPNLAYSDAASYPLPRQIRFGVSRPFIQNRLVVAADYNSPLNYFDDFRIGTEFKAHRNVSLRLGYRRELGTVDEAVTGISYGLGLHFGSVSLDYAMTPSDDFDNVQRFAFGYSFGGGADETPTKPAPPKKDKPLPPAPPKTPTTIAAAPKQAPKQTPKPVVKQTAPVSILADSKALAAAPDAPVAKSPTRAAPDSAVAAPPPASAPAKSSPPPVVVAEAPAPKAEPKETKESKESKDSGESKDAKQEKETKPAKVIVEHAVLLLGYSSMESAQAEMKALQLLGFRTKDASIVIGPKGGYCIRLAQMKSKESADGMVSSLARMSFRAVVETVQR